MPGWRSCGLGLSDYCVLKLSQTLDFRLEEISRLQEIRCLVRLSVDCNSGRGSDVMMSPGSRVIEEKNSTSSRILNTMFFVLENCLIWPLTRSSISKLSGLPAWSGVTRKGPIGAKEAKFLPKLQKPLFISANWISRALMSLKREKPAT